MGNEEGVEVMLWRGTRTKVGMRLIHYWLHSGQPARKQKQGKTRVLRRVWKDRRLNR